MNSFILSYPSLFLAGLYDPAINVIEKKSLEQIKTELKSKLITTFNHIKLNDYVNGEGDWQKWYWLAPLLLDRVMQGDEITTKWLAKGIPPSELSIDAEDIYTDKEESIGKKTHFELAKVTYLNPKSLAVGKLNPDQLDIICEHLAELTIGSPAICYLRTQKIAIRIYHWIY